MAELVVGLVSAILGFFGGLFAPWVKWHIEKRRLKRREQQSLIALWVTQIEMHDFGKKNYGETYWYASLRPHMNPEIVEKLEKPRTIYVSNGGRGQSLEKQWLLDEVARLENEVWKL